MKTILIAFLMFCGIVAVMLVKTWLASHLGAACLLAMAALVCFWNLYEGWANN